ncbi:MAG: hypothetical protein QXS01_05570 [Candidatus Bathyarchaeia archaeon]
MMVQRWILMSSIVMLFGSQSVAQPKVTVQGILKGYFLSHDGNLSVYEVPFAFPDQPAPSDLPKRLFPLWAGYYLQGGFSSQKPIQSIWLLSGSGRLIWRRHYPENVKEGTIPHQMGGWVGIKGQDGLSLRLLIRFEDGNETLIRPNFPTQFDRVLPLKVDWLDFIRIAEVAHLLKEKGKEIWEGFSLDGIPFLLEGDEGQWVLINHPKPPKGFVRYEGPLPKVPLAMTVHVGKGGRRESQEEMGGWVEKVNGVWTTALRYFPNWWVLTDCAPPGYVVIREPNAVYRLETIVHETFHVWWIQRTKPFKRPKLTIEDPSVEILEREYLARALETTNDEEAKQWAKAFLFQRFRRRLQQGLTLEQIMYERFKEMTEGIATFVSWQALREGQTSHYQPLSAMVADKEFVGYRPKGLKEVVQTLRLAYRTLGHIYASGLAQALLLERWDKKWRRKVPNQDLESLLSAIVAAIPLSAEKLQELDQHQKENSERTEAVNRNQKTFNMPIQDTFTIWLPLPQPILSYLGKVHQQWLESLPELSFETNDLTAVIDSPSGFKIDRQRGRVGIPLRRTGQLSLIHRPDGLTVLQGEGVKVQGKLQVTWDANGVHVCPDEKTQKTTGGVSPMICKKTWHAIVLPVALLMGLSGQGYSQGVITGITGDLSGVFHAATGNFTYETLPLAGTAPDGVERYFVTDEVYTGRLTVNHADTFPFNLNFWVIVSWNFVEGGGSYWTVTGAITDYSGGDPLSFAPSLSPESQESQQERKKLKIKFRYRDSKGREWETEVEYESVKTPPLGSITIGASVLDVETGDCSRIGVNGYIWRQSQPEKKIPFEFTRTTPAIVSLPPADDYTAEATSREPIPGLCRTPIKSGPETFSIVANASGSIGFLFIRHKGIRGRVLEQTSNGVTPLPGAKVYVLKNGQQLPGEWKSWYDGYFEIPAHVIDAWLEQYGEGVYTVKVVPPARSMRQPNPTSIPRDTPSLTKCVRKSYGEFCPRDTTVNLGDFVFTYQPPNNPPGGSGS